MQQIITGERAPALYCITYSPKGCAKRSFSNNARRITGNDNNKAEKSGASETRYLFYAVAGRVTYARAEKCERGGWALDPCFLDMRKGDFACQLGDGVFLPLKCGEWQVAFSLFGNETLVQTKRSSLAKVVTNEILMCVLIINKPYNCYEIWHRTQRLSFALFVKEQYELFL